MSIKNSNNTIGNRTRDLPVCNAVPQPLRHRVPPTKNVVWTFFYIRGACKDGGLWHRKWPVRINSAESKKFENKFWLWSEYITEHLNGLNVKLLGTKNLMASLRDNIKSSSDKTSVLVNANKESKLITFELGKSFNLSDSCVRLNCYPENNGLFRIEF
jgi:hypothetical protein